MCECGCNKRGCKKSAKPKHHNKSAKPKRQHNEYMKKMLAARGTEKGKEKPSFQYKGKTYYKTKLRSGLVTYRSKK